MPNDAVIEIQGLKLADYQKAILNSSARFTVTEATSKGGKTLSHLYWLFREAHNPPKKGANYWWVAPVYNQAKIAFTRMRRVVAAHPMYRINESELYIRTPLGSTIYFKSAEKPDNLYGEDVHAAVFDEFTRSREEAWYALRSTLTATRGKCKFIGNVKGKLNWGYRLAQLAKSGTDPEYAYFKITAWDAVDAGILRHEEVEQAQRDLPENVFKELYLCEPQEDGSNPFGYSYIDDCIIPQLSPKVAVSYGIDVAKHVDYTVIIGLDEDGAMCFYKRFQADYDKTEAVIKQSIPIEIPTTIDSTGVGDPIAERLKKHFRYLNAFKYTNTSKEQIILSLAIAIQQGKIKIIDGEIVSELRNFELELGNNDKRFYNAPSGMHDDCVNALALAWWGYLNQNRIKIKKPKYHF